MEQNGTAGKHGELVNGDAQIYLFISYIQYHSWCGVFHLWHVVVCRVGTIGESEVSFTHIIYITLHRRIACIQFNSTFHLITVK